jgi:hypothetical protein
MSSSTAYQLLAPPVDSVAHRRFTAESLYDLTTTMKDLKSLVDDLHAKVDKMTGATAEEDSVESDSDDSTSSTVTMIEDATYSLKSKSDRLSVKIADMRTRMEENLLKTLPPAELDDDEGGLMGQDDDYHRSPSPSARARGSYEPQPPASWDSDDKRAHEVSLMRRSYADVHRPVSPAALEPGPSLSWSATSDTGRLEDYHGPVLPPAPCRPRENMFEMALLFKKMSESLARPAELTTEKVEPPTTRSSELATIAESKKTMKTSTPKSDVYVPLPAPWARENLETPTVRSWELAEIEESTKPIETSTKSDDIYRPFKFPMPWARENLETPTSSWELPGENAESMKAIETSTQSDVYRPFKLPAPWAREKLETPTSSSELATIAESKTMKTSTKSDVGPIGGYGPSPAPELPSVLRKSSESEPVKIAESKAMATFTPTTDPREQQPPSLKRSAESDDKDKDDSDTHEGCRTVDDGRRERRLRGRRASKRRSEAMPELDREIVKRPAVERTARDKRLKCCRQVEEIVRSW